MADGPMDLSKESAETLKGRRREAEAYLGKVNALGFGMYELGNEYEFPERVELIPVGADQSKIPVKELESVTVPAKEFWYRDAAEKLFEQFKAFRQADENALLGYVQKALREAKSSVA